MTSESTAAHNGNVGTRNVGLLMEMVSRLQNRTAGLPGMGAFYGPPGWGKSRAICVTALSHDVYYVQMKTLWSRKYLLESILRQMNIKPERTMSYMLEQIGKQLALSRRPLLIDDAHIALERGMIEVMRDIYETSLGTVILVGEEMMPHLLEKVERVHSRILDWVACEKTDLDDARKFATVYCANALVADDLLEDAIEAAGGSARYVCNSLASISEFAAMKGLMEVNAASYTGKLFTGKAPERRKL